MTPDILKAISSIVNKELVPQNLNEVEKQEKSETQQNPTASADFKSALNKLDWKDATMKSTTRYKYSNPKSIKEMEPMSYMKCTQNDNSMEKVNNQTVRKDIKAGDFIFKDTNGSTRIVRKNAIDKDYEGTVGSTLLHRQGKATKVALYRGADVEFSAGSEKKTLRSGQYLIKDGDGYTNLTISDFNKNFELKRG